MNNITVFENVEFGKVRTVMKDGEVWFVGKDIAEILGYARPNDAVSSHCKGTTKHRIGVTTGTKADGSPTFQEIDMNIIPERDVYRLIMRSKLPSAEKFEEWVVGEVLPTIRKTLNSFENIEYKGSIDNLVWSKNGFPITTSRVIAEYTNKEHKNILRDIVDEIAKLKNIGSNLSQSDYKLIIQDFKENIYLDSYGREQKEYELGEIATMQLLLKYSTEHRAKFIIMFYKMKEAINNMFKARVIESVLPQDNRLRQYIYVVKNPLNETVKIGVAQDVEKRIKQLQTGAGIELELIYQSLICSNAFSIEKDVHSKFETYRTFGEWFKINPEIVINFLENQTFVLKSEFSKQLGILKYIKEEGYKNGK